MTLKRRSPLKRKKALTSKTQIRSSKTLNKNAKFTNSAKIQEWDEVRADLKLQFQNVLKITECEAKLSDCWVNNGLTFAHAKKRRYLSKEELYDVILCCIQCHTTIENYQHSQMQEFVETIINNRNKTNNKDIKIN